MTELPNSNEFRAAVQRELRVQYTRSIKRKTAVLLVVIAGLVTIYGLDRMKLKLKETRETPYLASDVAEYLKTDPLLGEAAKKLPAGERYTDAKALFEALLARTDSAAAAAKEKTGIRAAYVELAGIDRRIREAAVAATIPGVTKEEEARSAVAALRVRRAELIATRTAEIAEADKNAAPRIRAAYAKPLARIDEEIQTAVIADPQPETKVADGAKALLATLKARRAELIAARAGELNEAEQSAAANVAALQRTFDELGVAEGAKSKFEPTTNERLDRFLGHLADPEHPLSIIYDMLWYAGLIVAVLALAALLLTPLFRILPIAGVEDPIMDRVRGLFGRAPRSVGTSVARLAAMVIGTAAVVSVATTAPSSPAMTSALLSPPPAAAEMEAAAKDRESTPRPPNERESGKVLPPANPVPSSDPPPQQPTPQTPQPPPGVLADNGCLNELICAVRQLESDNAIQRERLKVHEEALTMLAPFPARVANLVQEEKEQVDQLEDFFGETREEIAGANESAAKAAVQAQKAADDAATVERDLDSARRLLEKRADGIEAGLLLPYKLGERPPLLASLLGFDHYRVTDASVAFMEKAGAPSSVVEAVRAMKSGGDLSNDELRQRLRQQLCGGSVNCDNHLAWRDTVLRAARRQ